MTRSEGARSDVKLQLEYVEVAMRQYPYQVWTRTWIADEYVLVDRLPLCGA